jgi:DNA polymerase-3 subunit chi
MVEISFYHFLHGSLEKSVAKLLEKVYQANLRSVVLVDTDEKKDFYDSLLWTFSSLSFLPHGSARDGNPELQPLWLTTQLENPNQAEVLVCLDGAQISAFDSFKRCLDIFNGHDDDALQLARKRWQFYKQENHTLTYWQQSPEGKWEKQDL